MSRSLLPVHILLALFIALLATLTTVHAQHDTRGKNFWVVFMANEGSSGLMSSDMRLYISSEVPTQVRIIYFGDADTAVVTIPQAGTTVEFDIGQRFGPGVELLMYEEFSPKAIQVLADDDITLYGVNIRARSADAFLSLPEDVLTNRYIVLGYPNAWLRYANGMGEYDMPSQFAIIGTEDGTTVRINPAAQLNGRSQSEFSITLDRGEVFNGQAVIGEYQDVSGTEIRSNKPVAVYGGTRRASVPLSIGNFRDHLIEQMPPLEVWGKEAVVTPHFTISPDFNIPDSAVYRVLAAFDNTRWQIDGVEQPPLMKAQAVERPLNTAQYITASDPILVAQYEHSAAYDQGGPNTVALPGDPFMMLIPPTEQFFNTYQFQSVSHPEFPSGHFVNVVIPTIAIPSLRIDGGRPVATWLPTPKPGYSYAQIDIGPGSHNATADSAFGIYVYGFGPASSYGYPGGMLFRTLVHDFEPPRIQQSVICLAAEGIAFDSRITDSGIDSLYLLPESRNVNVVIDPFAPGADTVGYRASLVDPYTDGLVSVKAIDSMGRSRTQTNPIPGFTLRAVGTTGIARVRLDTLDLLLGTDTCRTLTLENYGRFPQVVERISLAPSIEGVRLTTPMPITIPPGGRADVEVCAAVWADSLVTVDIDIVGTCLDRGIASLTILSGVDTIPPGITAEGSNCTGPVVVRIAETRTSSSRIAEIAFDELTNGRIISRTPEDGQLPAVSAEVRLEPIDPYRDMVYQIRVVDVAGNTSILRDTIGGFTITAIDEARDSVSARFDRDVRVADLDPAQERCDSVTIMNYGGRPITITSVRLNGNHIYSVPPAQMPFEIAPYSERRLAVCIEANDAGLVRDTLTLTDACGREDVVLLRGIVDRLMTEDGCNNALNVTSIGASKRTFLATPHPNPSSGGTATVDIGLDDDALVSFELVDANGTTVGVVMQSVEMRGGLHRVTFDISSLDNGSYFCRLRTADGEHHVEKLVVRR